MDSEDFNKALGEVITSLASRFEAQRQQEKPWKDLFASSEQGLKGILNEAANQTSSIILDLSDVIERKFNIKISTKLYSLLKALPFAFSDYGLRGHIVETEGNSCCADKTRFIYYQEVLAEINRIKNETNNNTQRSV